MSSKCPTPGSTISLAGSPAIRAASTYRSDWDSGTVSSASPLASVGDGARVVCVHGDADDTVPLSQSERYVEAARMAGDPAKLIVLPGVGHFELIDPGDPAWAVCRDQLLRMV